MLKFATRPEAAAQETVEERAPATQTGGKKDGREGLKAALVRPPVVAAVDLGAAKVTCQPSQVAETIQRIRGVIPDALLATLAQAALEPGTRQFVIALVVGNHTQVAN